MVINYYRIEERQLEMMKDNQDKKNTQTNKKGMKKKLYIFFV